MSNQIDDSKKLKEFLTHLELKMNIYVHEWGPLFLKIKNNKNGEKTRLMFNAWNETREQMNELRSIITSEESLVKLKLVGLTGSSLDFKLSLVEESVEELEELERLEIEEGNFSDMPKKRLGLLKKLKKSWGKYFDHADTIIGSMGAAGLPGADAVGEFKTVLEKILNWWGKK